MISNRERIKQEDKEDAQYRKRITTGIITMEEYGGTNLNIERMCGCICLEENRHKWYDVMVSRKDKNRRFYIRKNGFKYYLDDEVKKAFNAEMNVYNREGI